MKPAHVQDIWACDNLCCCSYDLKDVTHWMPLPPEPITEPAKEPMKHYNYDDSFGITLEENIVSFMSQLSDAHKEEFESWFRNFIVHASLLDFKAKMNEKELNVALAELKKLQNEIVGYRFANITPANVKMLVEEELKAKDIFFRNHFGPQEGQ